MSFERPNIQRMTGYSYGEQPDDATVIKLNTNELPYPPTPEVTRSLRLFNPEVLRRYPPALANEFRRAAAKLHGVQPENIIATRGGDELLRLLFTTFTDPGDTVVLTDPTYSLYPVLAKIQDVDTVQLPMAEGFELTTDFAQQANKLNAKMTFVVNPHAPSGKLLSKETIMRLASDLDSLLLVDEAYVDFIDPAHEYDCLQLAQEADNVIFLRTMSKGYGLAGLRFGYGIGHQSLIEPMLTKTRDSYNLDAISQQIATVALQDQEYAARCWHKVRESRTNLTAELSKREFSIPPSEANFLLAQVPEKSPSASEIYQQLHDRGIFVRYFAVPGLDNKLRISIGTPDENTRLLECLDEILSGQHG